MAYVTFITVQEITSSYFYQNLDGMKIVLTPIVFLFLFTVAFSQETITISKADLVTKRMASNLQLKTAKAETDIAEKELLASRAMYLPNVVASYTFTNTNNPLMAFGSKLNQERITAMDFDPAKLNDPNSISNFGTKVELQQPIINMDAVYQKKAAQVKADVLKIKTERTEEYIRFELLKAYMMLQLAYKMRETLENAKATTLANKQVVDNYYKNGMVQKSEVLYMEVRVSEIESQLQTATSNIRNASDYLYFLLNEDAEGKVLKPAEPLQYEGDIAGNNASLNSNRKDLQAYNKSLQTYDWMIKSSKAKYLPKLNAFGSWEMYDNKIFQFGANGYLVGLQLSWNVFDGLRAKSEQAKYTSQRSKSHIEMEQYTKQSQLELNKSVRTVLDASYKVSFTNQAWEHVKEAYRIRKNRYDQGLEKSADLLSAETLMLQKELEYQQAVFEYNTAAAYITFLKQ